MVKLLVVDDDPEIVELLSGFFKEQGYRVQTATNGEEALEKVKIHRPHLVFLDIKMKQVSGIEVLRRIRDQDPAIKVIMITALAEEKMMAAARELGASEYVTKPFDLDTLYKQVMKKVHAQLYEDLRVSYDELEKTLSGVISAFASVVHKLDPHYTHEHIQRVLLFGKKIVTKLVERGVSLEGTSEDMFLAGVLLHDVGKIFTPREILYKPGPLSDEEWKVMKLHPVDGAELFEQIEGLKGVAKIIRHHQEKWDGTGYPDGLKAEEIPLGSRVAAVVDAFDAITHDRPYRKGRSVAEALEELKRCAGTQFDPTMVEIMVAVCQENPGQEVHV